MEINSVVVIGVLESVSPTQIIKVASHPSYVKDKILSTWAYFPLIPECWKLDKKRVWLVGFGSQSSSPAYPGR